MPQYVALVAVEITATDRREALQRLDSVLEGTTSYGSHLKARRAAAVSVHPNPKGLESFLAGVPRQVTVREIVHEKK